MAPELSVVVPAYNASRFLTATIASVQNQTLRDWELLIVDDGSTDGTHEIALAEASRDERIRVFRVPNGGAGSARDFGLEHANRGSRFVAFLDADDLYDPDALETLLHALELAPGSVAAHGLARFIDAHGRPIRNGAAEGWGLKRRSVRGLRSVPWPRTAATTLPVLAHWNTIHTPGQVVVRKTALQRVGRSDETLAIAQDYDLWLRLLALGDFAFVDRVVMSYRQHEGGISRDEGRLQLETRYVVRRLLESSTLSPAQRRACLVAALHSPLLMRFGWAKEALRRGEVRSALKELPPLLGAYARLAGVLPGVIAPKLALGPLTKAQPRPSSA
jgi:GT2 family glycosyltransferase